MDKENIIMLAEGYLARVVQDSYEESLAIDVEGIFERKGFYVVPFNSVDYIKSGGMSDSVKGNNKIILSVTHDMLFRGPEDYELDEYLEYLQNFGHLYAKDSLLGKHEEGEELVNFQASLKKLQKRSSIIHRLGMMCSALFAVTAKLVLSLDGIYKYVALLIALIGAGTYYVFYKIATGYIRNLVAIKDISENEISFSYVGKNEVAVDASIIEKVVYKKRRSSVILYTSSKKYTLNLRLYDELADYFIVSIKEELCRNNGIKMELNS